MNITLCLVDIYVYVSLLTSDTKATLTHQKPIPSFVSISNWRLDLSKMSRCIYVTRPDLSKEDLIETSKQIITKLVRKKNVFRAIFKNKLIEDENLKIKDLKKDIKRKIKDQSKLISKIYLKMRKNRLEEDREGFKDKDYVRFFIRAIEEIQNRS